MVGKKDAKKPTKESTKPKAEKPKKAPKVVKMTSVPEVEEPEIVEIDEFEATTDIISWEAQEYIVRDKTGWWYVGLAVVAVALIALAVWLEWWTFIAVVILSVIALLIYVMRPPRVLRYSLSNKGISEGSQLHPYTEFRSFGILQEGGHFAIVLTPRKRFSPRITVYFPESQGEEIVDAFGMRLPMEEVKLDLLDKLIKFLRI